MTHGHGEAKRDPDKVPCMCESWLIRMWVITHSYACDMNLLCVWHESFRPTLYDSFTWNWLSLIAELTNFDCRVDRFMTDQFVPELLCYDEIRLGLWIRISSTNSHLVRRIASQNQSLKGEIRYDKVPWLIHILVMPPSCVSWLIHVCDMTRLVHICVSLWLIHMCHMPGLAHMCESWLIHMCDMARLVHTCVSWCCWYVSWCVSWYVIHNIIIHTIMIHTYEERHQHHDTHVHTYEERHQHHDTHESREASREGYTRIKSLDASRV